VIDATDSDARVSALEAQLARFAVEMQETTAQLRKVEDERDEYRKLVMLLKEQVERLRRGLLGQKAERLPRNDAQLSLAILGMGLAGEAGTVEAEAAAQEWCQCFLRSSRIRVIARRDRRQQTRLAPRLAPLWRERCTAPVP
jgi:hypothetical protein